MLREKETGISDGSLTPLANNLTRRIQPGRDHVIGESFLCEEDDFGADHITIRCVYFLAIDSSACRSSLERFTLNGLFLGIRDPIALMQAYQITSPIRLSKYVIVFPNSCT